MTHIVFQEKDELTRLIDDSLYHQNHNSIVRVVYYLFFKIENRTDNLCFYPDKYTFLFKLRVFFNTHLIPTYQKFLILNNTYLDFFSQSNDVKIYGINKMEISREQIETRIKKIQTILNLLRHSSFKLELSKEYFSIYGYFKPTESLLNKSITYINNNIENKTLLQNEIPNDVYLQLI
jgi:hypothetical protein